MKKLIIGIVIALTVAGVGLFQAIPALADSTGPLSYVEISPDNTDLAPGITVQFTAQAYDNEDLAISGASYFWMIDNEDAGTISTTGLFTAGITPGEYTVQVVAAKGDYSATTSTAVTVLDAGDLEYVTITPVSATVVPGGTFQFTAQGYDNSDIPVPGLNYTWGITGTNSVDGSIGTETGLLTVSLMAATGTYTDTVMVTVTDGDITKTDYATVTVVASGTLDHITVTPSSISVQTGKTRQFTARGYDANNSVISGLTFTWSVINGGGTIGSTGLFTAGSTKGTYSNTVQATVSGSNIYGYTTVTVTAGSTERQNQYRITDINRLGRMWSGICSFANFENFLGGQFQVKNGTAVDTIKIIPGVVQTGSTDTTLIVLPNDGSGVKTFDIASAVLRPRDTTLEEGDNVVVITVNDTVETVIEVTVGTGPGSGWIPPGLRKNQENREGKDTPPGWSQGNKTGWGDKSDKGVGNKFGNGRNDD